MSRSCRKPSDCGRNWHGDRYDSRARSNSKATVQRLHRTLPYKTLKEQLLWVRCSSEDTYKTPLPNFSPFSSDNGQLWFWGAFLVGGLVAGLFGNMLRETAVG